MAQTSVFESRTANLSCSSKDVYTFVTDIRNFERFIPEGKIDNWHAEKESCSFSVPMLGTVSVKLVEKEMYNKVGFTGDALKKNDISLVLNISESVKNSAMVKVILQADINPMLKMMAAKPIAQFLEKLIDEMEKFRGWNDIRE